MPIKNYIKKLKTSYVISKVKRTTIPSFEPASHIRKEITFLGKVQNIGFRLEIYELARRLGLTGSVRNKNDNKVELEIQGKDKKILFLVENMKNLKRAKVSHVEMNEIPLLRGEYDFIIKPR